MKLLDREEWWTPVEVCLMVLENAVVEKET